MPWREVQPDEEQLPLGAQPPPAAAAARPRFRLVDPTEEQFPLGSKPPPKPYEPTLADTLFGRTDPTGNKNVEGFLPDLGSAAYETGKDALAGIMRGGAAVGDLAETGMRKLTNWYTQASPEDVARGERQQEEDRQGAQEFFTPKDQTPAGRVLGGLGEIVLPLAATGGNPALLVASEYERKKKDLMAQGVDEQTADRLAAVHGMATAAGMKLPFFGKTLTSRVLTGAGGNVVLNTAEQQQERQELEDAIPPLTPEQQAAAGAEFEGTSTPEGKQALAQASNRSRYQELADQIPKWWDPEARIGDILMGGAFGLVHHLTTPAEAAPGANRGAGPAPIEAELVPPGPRTPPPGGPGVTVEGQTIKPAYPELPPPPPKQIPGEVPPHELNPVEQETELANMGLTPDVIANIMRHEDAAEAAKAARVLPAPNTTLVAGPDGQVRPAVDVEAQARTEARARDLAAKQAEDAANAEAARKQSLGLTPDVEANLARLQSRPIGDELAAQAQPAPAVTGSEVPQKRADTGVPSQTGEAAQTPTAEQGVTHGETAQSTVQVPAGYREVRPDEEQHPLSTQKPAPKAKKSKSALEFLASKGGLSIEALEKEGIDRADMQRVPGFKRPFTRKGMSLDAAAEALHEAGYPVADEAGRPDANKALAIIDAETRHGTRTLPRGEVEVPEKPAEQRGQIGEQRAGTERRAPPPRETPDRRGEIGERRKPVAQMTTEEARTELLTSRKTGLPSKMAYEDAGLDKKPHQASIDIDTFKWFNDTFSHDQGDEVLRALGQALTGHDVYHLSGDEFAIAGDTEQEIHDRMEAIREAAAKVQLTFENAKGERWTVDGLGLSYGVGPTLKEADARLQSDKSERKARGERGAQPTGAHRVEPEVSAGQDETGVGDGEGKPGGVSEPATSYRATAERAESADVEHVTLTGEGHVSHTERGGGEHVETGHEPVKLQGVAETGDLEGDTQELTAALRYAQRHPGDVAYAKLRRLLSAFESNHGQGELSALLDKLDAEHENAPDQPPAEKPAKPLEEGETGDLFTKREARPGTTDRQLEIANQLLDELAKEADGPVGEIAPIAQIFNHEYRADHGASLVGKKITNTHDLGYLAQIFRDPRYETLRYFFLNDKRVIVGQTGVSSKLPGSASAFPGLEQFEWVRAMMKRAGATQLIMQHNHPGGHPRPSDEDLAITDQMSRELGIPVEHVIVDSGKFATWRSTSHNPDQPRGDADRVQYHPVEGEDPVFKSSRPHRLLGTRVDDTSTAVALAKELEKEGAYLTLAGMSGAEGKVRSLGDVPAHLIENVNTEQRGLKLRSELRRYGVQNGNQRQVLVGVPRGWLEANKALVENLINDEFLSDIIDVDGKSAYHLAGVRLHPAQGSQRYGTIGIAKEIKTRPPEPRREQQQDLLGDDVETRNKVAAAERAKDKKRSPNKDVSANLGVPGDLFTLNKNHEINEPLEPPSDVSFQTDASAFDNTPDDESPGEIKIHAMRDGRNVGGIQLELANDGDHMRIRGAGVEREHQGQGIGQELIRQAYEAANSRGLGLQSDHIVSVHQLRAYEALRKQGWQIEYSRPDLVKAKLAGKTDILDDQFPTLFGSVRIGGDTPVVKTIKPPRHRIGSVEEKAAKYAATPAFQKWFGESKVVDEEGKPLVVYHGTTRDFETFDPEKADPGADQGRGLYFTDSKVDVGNNYAGVGQDLKGRVELRSEELQSERWKPEMTKDEQRAMERQALKDARAEIMPNKGVTMPVYLKIEHPAHIGGGEKQWLTHELEYENPEDPDSEIVGQKGSLVDFMDELQREAELHGTDASEAIEKLTEAAGYDRISLDDALDIVRNDEKLGYAEDPDNGKLAGHEVIRRALEAAGFDGVIDHTPNKKWGTASGRSKPMRGLIGTKHYIAFHPEQVKSAIGNKGTYDPESRSIVEQAAPPYRGAPSQKGDKGYAAVAQKAINAFNKRLGWRYGPLGRLPEQTKYLEERYKALGAVKAGQEIARNTYKALREATPEDAKATYEYLTNKNGDPSTIADPEVRQAARDAKRVIDAMGQRLVDRGLLSQEAYDAHKGEYLPRLYLKHVLGDSVNAAIGGGKKLSDLGYLKPRQDIPEEVRKVILGEITDPAFLASFGIARTQRDLALVDFLHAIAGRELWTPKHSTVEWRGRQVTPFYLADEARELRRRAQFYTDPKAKAAALKMADEAQAIADEGLNKLEARPDPGDFEQIPNSKRYGALRGMYVRKEIYNDLVGAQGWVPPGSSVAEALLGQGGLAARAQSWWKLSKVILNPPTQVRNFVANMMLLHLSGVPFHRVYSGEIIGKAINSIYHRDRFYQVGTKYGMGAATFANTEGARIRDEWLALQDMKGGGLAKMRAFAGRMVNAASDFYQLMEMIGKIAKIRDAMEREGKSEAQAALEAHEALFDYSLVPRSVQYLRNAPVGAPFITFAYKAAAQMAKIAAKHPERFAPYVAIPFLLAALLKNSYDVNSEDVRKLKNAFPQWMKQRGHMLLLPYKDERGRWQNVDMGYLTPWGQFADMYAQAKEGGGAGKLAGSLVFSGPMMDVANAIQTNVDPFTGKPIVDDRDPPADQVQSMMQYAWNLTAPGWLTEQGALNQLRKSLTGTNLNKKTGEPGMTPTQAALRLIGLNVYPVDPKQTREQNLSMMATNLEQSEQRMTQVLSNKNLTPAERAEIKDTFTKLIKARAEEIRLYKQESEINPKLR